MDIKKREIFETVITGRHDSHIGDLVLKLEGEQLFLESLTQKFTLDLRHWDSVVAFVDKVKK